MLCVGVYVYLTVSGCGMSNQYLIQHDPMVTHLSLFVQGSVPVGQCHMTIQWVEVKCCHMYVCALWCVRSAPS